MLTNGTPATVAVERETRTIPVVFATVGDPVASGIVARLDRPSGNVTGFALFEATLGGKWLELLSEIAPGLKRAAMMFNPDTFPASTYVPSVETAARSLKVEPITAPVHDDVEIETAITVGWRIESYGNDTILAREVGGTLDAEIAKGKSRTDILIASRDAIARLVRRGVRTTTRREFEDRLAAAHHLLGACHRKAGANLNR
jgi:hypothetical protein